MGHDHIARHGQGHRSRSKVNVKFPSFVRGSGKGRFPAERNARNARNASRLRKISSNARNLNNARRATFNADNATRWLQSRLPDWPALALLAWILEHFPKCLRWPFFGTCVDCVARDALNFRPSTAMIALRLAGNHHERGNTVGPTSILTSPSLFHSRFKTYLFHKSYPRSFTSSTRTASTNFCQPAPFFWATRFFDFIFSLFFVSGPCARLARLICLVELFAFIFFHFYCFCVIIFSLPFWRIKMNCNKLAISSAFERTSICRIVSYRIIIIIITKFV